jgi:hypothetical protein
LTLDLSSPTQKLLPGGQLAGIRRFGRNHFEKNIPSGAKCRVSRGCYHRAGALKNRGLWKRWKTKNAFHFPTTPAVAAGIESVDDARFRGLKPRFLFKAQVGTVEAVPFQNDRVSK